MNLIVIIMKKFILKILLLTATILSCGSSDDASDITADNPNTSADSSSTVNGDDPNNNTPANTNEGMGNSPENTTEEEDCENSPNNRLTDFRGPCNETLTFNTLFTQSTSSTTRTITTNNIPNHNVGIFGDVPERLNPNAISEQNSTYEITTTPEIATSLTPLLNNSGVGRQGPQYAFGVLLNGVELDPIAAEPFPHSAARARDPLVNWEWNLEALTALDGLDCNNAHVQPTGKYHYHGSPTLYLESINIQSTQMTLIGYAADGFPIYYKYAYSEANNASSPIIEMTPSYQLKTGNRPGDGITAPCGTFNGIYDNDYEFVNNLGTLDEANGRTGVTPEFPGGTYYYVITAEFPSVPRYFRGTPSDDFKIGG